jgi:hypothetical protein
LARLFLFAGECVKGTEVTKKPVGDNPHLPHQETETVTSTSIADGAQEALVALEIGHTLELLTRPFLRKQVMEAVEEREKFSAVLEGNGATPQAAKKNAREAMLEQASNQITSKLAAATIDKFSEYDKAIAAFNSCVRHLFNSPPVWFEPTHPSEQAKVNATILQIASWLKDLTRGGFPTPIKNTVHLAAKNLSRAELAQQVGGKAFKKESIKRARQRAKKKQTVGGLKGWVK